MISTLRRTLIVAVCTCLFAPAAQCAPIFESGTERNTLLELYTAEACPSCPPAEDWVNALKDRDSLWDEYIPVVFHVDYWNRKNWTDPFARSGFSTRQILHSANWKEKGLHTPCVLLNGIRWMKWRSMSTVPRASPKTVGILTVEEAGRGRFRARFTPTQKSRTKYKLSVSRLGFGVKSRIGGGAAKGKQRIHQFIALDCQQVSLEEKSGALTAEFSMTTSMDPRVSRYGMAVWVTQDADMVPIQATGGYLKN